MVRLDEREWRRFDFTDIFVIGHGFYNRKPETTSIGEVPFIGASASNNGVTGFCTMDAIRTTSRTGSGTNEALSRKLFDGNTLAVVNNGNPGSAYYEPMRFTCSHDINPLTLKDHELTESLGLFLGQCIQAQGVCFAYARKWRPSRMTRSQLMLPVDPATGEPDWAFMEAYVAERRERLLAAARAFLSRRLEALRRAAQADGDAGDGLDGRE